MLSNLSVLIQVENKPTHSVLFGLKAIRILCIVIKTIVLLKLPSLYVSFFLNIKEIKKNQKNKSPFQHRILETN